METLEGYWNLVRERICANCIYGDGSGECSLPTGKSCALYLYFGDVVGAVRSLKSEQMEPYVDALRRTVCAKCTYQSSEGECVLRSNVECGLDRYFPLVVQAIEEMNERQETSPTGS